MKNKCDINYYHIIKLEIYNLVFTLIEHVIDVVSLMLMRRVDDKIL